AAWRAALNSVGVIERRSMPNAGSSEFQVLECKQCHGFISSTETIAYHLVDQILYGWCGDCFARRGEADSAEAGQFLRVEGGFCAALNLIVASPCSRKSLVEGKIMLALLFSY